MDSCGEGLPGGLTMVCKFVDVFDSLSGINISALSQVIGSRSPAQ